jgi:hypothetical protein
MMNFRLSSEISLALAGSLILLLLIYVVMGECIGTVNNTPLPSQPTTGESHIAAATARMIERELDSGFCPSAIFWPGHIRYDICGFQEGEQQILQRVVMLLSDHLTREGVTSDRDPDLNVAWANVNRPNTWSMLFTSNNTASLLAKAAKHLDLYNQRLRDNKAGFYPRIDNLGSLVGDLTNILGSESKRLEEKAANSGFYSMQSRAAYFHTLGTMAAACWTLEAAESDFDQVLKLQSAETIFNQAMQATCTKIGKNPTIVINGDDLSHLLSLSGATATAVNNLTSLQTALAAAPHNH